MFHILMKRFCTPYASGQSIMYVHLHTVYYYTYFTDIALLYRRSMRVYFNYFDGNITAVDRYYAAVSKSAHL